MVYSGGTDTSIWPIHSMLMGQFDLWLNGFLASRGERGEPAILGFI